MTDGTHRIGVYGPHSFEYPLRVCFDKQLRMSNYSVRFTKDRLFVTCAGNMHMTLVANEHELVGRDFLRMT